MATNIVQIVGDQSSMLLKATNLTGSEMVFLSGSFRGTADDRRVCSVFLEVGVKTLELRFELVDPSFVETTVTGQDLVAGSRE